MSGIFWVVTMVLDPEKQYTALAWFVAGYMAAASGYEEGDEWNATQYVDTTDALDQATSAYDKYREGRCLACRREGIALLDGFFCGKCSPGINEEIEP